MKNAAIVVYVVEDGYFSCLWQEKRSVF